MHAVPTREEEVEALRGILSLVLGHGIVASTAAACYGTRQRRSGTQHPTGRFDLQSVAYNEGMRRGDMRQPWSDARIVDLAEITPAVGIGRSRGRGWV
jgi:hypothetical protein